MLIISHKTMQIILCSQIVNVQHQHCVTVMSFRYYPCFQMGPEVQTKSFFFFHFTAGFQSVSLVIVVWTFLDPPSNW